MIFMSHKGTVLCSKSPNLDNKLHYCVCVSVCLCSWACNGGLACLLWPKLFVVILLVVIAIHFLLEVSQHGCSLYLNFVHSTELHFYVRGLRFRNLSLLLLLFFFLLNLYTFGFTLKKNVLIRSIHYIFIWFFFCQLWTLQRHHLNRIIPLSTLHLYFASKVIKYDIHTSSFKILK